jgi:hypothetical protein
MILVLLFLFVNKGTDEVTLLNPSQPPFTKGGELFPSLYQRGARGDFSEEGLSSAVREYVTELMKYTT